MHEGIISMKKVILAAALLAVGASSASAQFVLSPYNRGEHRYEQRHHRVCQEKAWRLRDFDRRALSNDGRFDRRERQIHNELRADLDRRCGGFRWRG